MTTGDQISHIAGSTTPSPLAMTRASQLIFRPNKSNTKLDSTFSGAKDLGPSARVNDLRQRCIFAKTAGIDALDHQCKLDPAIKACRNMTCESNYLNKPDKYKRTGFAKRHLSMLQQP